MGNVMGYLWHVNIVTCWITDIDICLYSHSNLTKLDKANIKYCYPNLLTSFMKSKFPKLEKNLKSFIIEPSI